MEGMAGLRSPTRTTTLTTNINHFSDDQITPRANAHTISSSGTPNQMMQTSYCGVPGFSVKYRSHGLTLSPLAEGPQPTPPPKNALRPAGFTRKNSRGQEYDALYDSSDSEFEDVPLACSRSVKASRQGHQANGSTSTTSTDASGRKVRNYPSLVIPSPSMWPTIEKLRSATSPNSKSRIVPPSPSHILSPTARALNMIAAKNALVPNGSAAPSLDGSLTSEELSGISCPSTPDVGNDAKPDDAEWAGTVQLGPEAMETLQRFRLGSFNEHSEDDEDQVIEIRGEMRESHLENGGMATSINLIVTPVDSEPEDFFPTLSNPGSDLDPLSALSVPSPGGFFGSLNGNARNTWGQGAGDAVPNTSTAISFYGVPWKKSRENSPERTVERVIEVDIDGSSDNDTTGPPTARRLPGTDGMTLGGEAETGNRAHQEPVIEISTWTSSNNAAPNEHGEGDSVGHHHDFRFNLDVDDTTPDMWEDDSPRLRMLGTPELRLITDFSGEFEYNPAYAAEQHKENSSHIDRTNLWLYSQEHYLAGLRGDIPTMTNGDDSPIVGHLATGTDEPRKSSLGNASTTLSPSKSVRFADDPEITAGIDGALARLNGESPPRVRRPIPSVKLRNIDGVTPVGSRSMSTRSSSMPEASSTLNGTSLGTVLSPPGSTIVPPPLPPIPETVEPVSASEDKDPVFLEGFKHIYALQNRGSPRSSRTTKSGPRPLSPKSPPAAAFSHRKARNEALRLGRTCLPQKHRDIVAGVFSLEEREHIDPKRPISAWHGANSGGKLGEEEDNPEDKDAQARKAVAKELKERHALDQIKPISWNLEATKMLNGGSLLTSPAAREFTSLSASVGSISPASPNDQVKRSKRIDPFGRTLSEDKHARKVLDLGGKATADWAWQVAIEYPRVGVWTACVNESPLNKKVFGPLPPLPSTQSKPKSDSMAHNGKDKKDAASTKDETKQNDASLLKGPPNHHEIKIPNLWTLPFPDNSFDVVSARSLYSILKTTIPPQGSKLQDSSSTTAPNDSSTTMTANGQGMKRTPGTPPARPLDEYDRALLEVHRVLKPGGYVEFALLDADIIGGGPITQKLSVEFAFNLRTRGYDPAATQGFLSRVRRSGFKRLRRAWIILPMSGVGAPECGPWVDRGLAWEQEGKRGLGIETEARSTAEKLRQMEREKEREHVVVPNRLRKYSDAASSVRTNTSTRYSYISPIYQTGGTRMTRSSTAQSSNSSMTAVSSAMSPTQRSAHTSATSLTLHSQGVVDAKTAAKDAKEDIGTTVDASYITGLVGAWAWEQWMLKLHTEMGREGEQLLEGVAAALEEGARMGGSWRYLSGWARKDL